MLPPLLIYVYYVFRLRRLVVMLRAGIFSRYFDDCRIMPTLMPAITLDYFTLIFLPLRFFFFHRCRLLFRHAFLLDADTICLLRCRHAIYADAAAATYAFFFSPMLPAAYSFAY